MTISKDLHGFDIEAVRKQFPGLGSGTVCLNNGSGALVYRGAIERLEKHGRRQRADRTVLKAGFIMNADPDEIAFGPSTTGLLHNLATSLLPNLNGDSEIIVSVLCHEAGVTAWLALAKALGISIKWWVPAGGMGNNTDPKLSLDTLRPLLSPKTRLVCCGHVSNITGTIENIKEVADLVHTISGALILVDGVAWAPHRPIDVNALRVDFYVFSWYKVFGPHIAQIYARRDVQKRYLTNLNHYFFDTTALQVRLGLGNSCIELEHAVIPIISYLTDGIGWKALIAHEEAITAEILGYLTAHPDLYTLYGSRSADPRTRVSLISFTVNGIESDKVAAEIHETSNFRLITGDCWSPRTVHDVLGLPEYGIIRASLVHYNTVDEMKAFIQKLHQVVRDLKHNCTIMDRPKD